MSKTALIIGGGTGIGKGIAAALHAQGYQVAIASRREDVLQAAAAEISGDGNKVLYQTVDATDEASVEELLRVAKKGLGEIDVFAYCAGVNTKGMRTVEECPPDEFKRLTSINLDGAYTATRPIALQMAKRGSGTIVLINSISGQIPFAIAGPGYVSSKYGLTGFGEYLSDELGGQGVRVTTIYPGQVNTPLLDDREVPPPAEVRAKMVQPEHIGQVVALIASMPAHVQIEGLSIVPTHESYRRWPTS